MIAPLDQMDAATTETRRRLRLARRLVAVTFFARPLDSIEDAPAIASRRAWLFTAWVVIVTAAYFATMLGFL
jgi:hypothetical protein